MKKIILCILCLILLCGCNAKEKTDAIKFKEEYEALNGTVREKDGKTIRTIEIDENNPMIYSTAEEIVKKIEKKETFVVYFGFNDCPWCRSMINNMIKACNDLGIEEVYYVNVKEIRDILVLDEKNNIITKESGSYAYYQLLEKLANVLEDYNLKDAEENNISTGEKRIFAPNVVSIVKGNAISMTDGISDNETDAYMKLTDKINKESYDKLKCSLKCISDVKEMCQKTC